MHFREGERKFSLSKGVEVGGGGDGQRKVLPAQSRPPSPYSIDTPPSISKQEVEENQASAEQGSQNKITSFISKSVEVGKQHNKN